MKGKEGDTANALGAQKLLSPPHLGQGSTSWRRQLGRAESSEAGVAGGWLGPENSQKGQGLKLEAHRLLI